MAQRCLSCPISTFWHIIHLLGGAKIPAPGSPAGRVDECCDPASRVLWQETVRHPAEGERSASCMTHRLAGATSFRHVCPNAPLQRSARGVAHVSLALTFRCVKVQNLPRARWPQADVHLIQRCHPGGRAYDGNDSPVYAPSALRIDLQNSYLWL